MKIFVGTVMVGIVTWKLDRSQTFPVHFLRGIRLPITTHFTQKHYPHITRWQSLEDDSRSKTAIPKKMPTRPRRGDPPGKWSGLISLFILPLDWVRKSLPSTQCFPF